MAEKELNRTIIKNLATDDVVYARGLRYYNTKAIKSMAKSKTREHYRATVQGNSEYTVDVDITDPENITYRCNCPASRKYSGACKHVVATLLYINDYKDRKRQKGIASSEERKITQILDYFDKLDFISGIGEIFHVQLEVNIPSMLKADNSVKAAISLFAGSTRMYKVQNARKFLGDYVEGRTIKLGKEFNFFPGESHFDKASEKILDFLTEIYDIQEMTGHGNISGIFNKSELYIDRHMLLRLLRLTNMPFNLIYGSEVFENVTFHDEKPDINFYLNLSDDDDSIVLVWDSGRIIPLDEKGKMFFFDGCIYHPDKLFTKSFLPLYSTMESQNDYSLTFEGSEKDRFLRSVLPRIQETFSLTIPDSLKENYITEDARFELYLDTDNGNLKLEVKAIYGDYSFNPFSPVNDSKVIIVRQPSREAACYDEIEGYGFVRDGRYFYMKDENQIYDFLTGGLDELTEKYEMFYSDAFKDIKVNPPKLLKTAVRIENDNNLLEVSFEYENVSKDELKELFKSLKVKKKFFRLKNGSFLDLTKGDLSRVNELLQRIGDITDDNVKDGNIVTSIDYAFYLNQAMKEGMYQMDMDRSVKLLVDSIDHPEESLLPLPEGINADVRPYQEAGYRWLSSLADHYLSGILADDMGLGKTLQTIIYLANVSKKNVDAVNLVVCPSSLVYNWEDEIENFAPELTTVMVFGAPEERHKAIRECKKYDIVLVSYPILRRDIDLLSKVHFNSIFLDEAQFIKNPNSQNAKAVKMLDADHRFALTGTPIENNLSELWSIFDFLMPGYLYTHAKFVNLYEKPVMRMNDKDALKQLNFHIKPFILRRMKKDVLTELPEKSEQKMISDMTDEQKEVYLSYLDSMKKEIDTEISKNGFEKSRMMILASLTRLRQICCHPSTFIENYDGGSGKMNLLMQLVSGGIENGHRILIFSQFTSMLYIIADALKEERIEYFYLDGSTPIEQRSVDVKTFNEGEGQVYLISLKAGGTGLNLTGADMVIHYDPWWNPAVEEQATDRVYRIGQKNNVSVMKLITKGTIEEKIYKLQEKKKDLADSVIQAGEVFLNKLTREEVDDLFKYQP